MRPENSGTENTPGGVPGYDEAQSADAKQPTGKDQEPHSLPKGEATMAVEYPWRRVVPRDFAEAIKEYPGVESKCDFRLLITLILSVKRDNPNQHIAIPFERIAECMGKASDIRHRNKLRGDNSTGEVLEDFLDRVLPEAEVIPHDHVRGLAREIAGVPDSLSDDIVDLRDRALHLRVEEDRVYLDYPIKSVTPKRKSTRKKEDEKRQDEWISQAVCEPQERLLRYLYRAGKGRRSRKFKPEDQPLTQAYEIATRDERSLTARLNALNQLAAIKNDPVPRYKPSYSENTVRVFTSGYSLCTISKDLRRTLQPEWIELDLASAQLAIVAHDWGLAELSGFLEAGRNIWDDLYDFMDWESYQGGVSRQCAKPVLKKGLYGAVFGASKETIRSEMYDTYIDSTYYPGFLIYDDLIDRIFDHPLISELMKERNRQLDAIEEEGGAVDAFGDEVSLGGTTGAPSVLAQLAQSRELQLLLPALGVAEAELGRVEDTEEYPRFWIMLWQHDGFSINVRDQSRRATVVSDFQDAVNGATGPYHTELEVDFPEDGLPD